VSDEEIVRVNQAQSGSWLPLDDAIRALGMSERVIFRLVNEGRLRSREEPNDRIEIWVADADRVDDTQDRPVEIIRPDHSLSLMERQSTTLGHQVTALTAPLAASYERNVQLARENGVLSERTAALEREVETLRAAAVSDKQALEQTRRRLEAVESAHAQLSRMMATSQDQQPSDRGGSRGLYVAVALLLVLVVLLTIAIRSGFPVPFLP
jgi:hypothetical protein